jgi:uroporphyrinogen decarboxylase
MDKLDNFQRMMCRRGAGHLPLDLPMTRPVRGQLERRTGFDNPTQAFDLDFQSVAAGIGGDPEAWREALSGLDFDWPEHCEVSGLGFAHIRPPAQTLGQADHLIEMIHPLGIVDRVEQLESLPWPELDESAIRDDLAADVERVHQTGRVAVGPMECTIFEFAWYARGMDQLFMDLADDNGIADWLLDWHTRRSCLLARAYARAGVDVIGLGDDVGTQHGMMMAPDYWRRHLRPRLARVIDTVRRHQADRHIRIRYHSDGAIGAILDDLVDIGVDILNPVQPECMPLDDLIPAYQDRLAFWGMVGTQTTMPFGTPDRVRAVVEQIAGFARHGAAVIAAPTHVVEPDVPWDNIVALVDAARSADVQPGSAASSGR